MFSLLREISYMWGLLPQIYGEWWSNTPFLICTYLPLILGELWEGRIESKQVKGESLSPMVFAALEVKKC